MLGDILIVRTNKAWITLKKMVKLHAYVSHFNKQDKQCASDVTMRSVRVTNVAAEKQ